MLVLARELVDLGHLGFCHFTCEHTANAASAGMHMQHDLGGALAIQREEQLQHLDHEIHRSEIIVDQEHLIQRWAGGFGLGNLHGNAMLVFLIRTVVAGSLALGIWEL